MSKRPKGKKKKSILPSLLLVLILLAGLSLLLYPTLSDYWNSLHQSQAIASYVETVEAMDEADYEAMWAAARAYNDALPRDNSRFHPSEEEQAEYDALLDVSGTGIMGYVEIPQIGVSLTIYHGTDEAVLQVAIGHIEGSSLPVGGAGTHCVISGHRGLPSAKLFTDLDQIQEGDTFLLHILDETLTYQVDQIHIVEPDDVTYLAIEEGQDLCTLVTCTPYGVNSHRLLVRGRRIETEETAAAIRVTADAILVGPMLVAPAIAAPILLILLIWLLVSSRKQGRKGPARSRDREQEE